MEPIAELEDDEEGFDYDSPSASMNDSRNMNNMQHFRSRSNTWPQFSSLAYDDLATDQADDDTHELTDKDDPLVHPPYSIYHESSYHPLQDKGLHSIDAETPLYGTNHLHPGAAGDFAGSRSDLSSTSASTNLALLKANPAAYFSSSTSPSNLTRASNHFSSRNDELDTGSPPEPAGINGSHAHLHGTESGIGSGLAGSGPATAASVASALKKNTSRRNAWGNMSYADLITQAINGSPEKRLTLSQIYEWMVQNVTYFKDKGDSNSSAGWKNSIRHNLSLHNRFMRVQNEGTGKSSWWMINPDAKPGKAARRRAISMETHNYEKRRGRVKRRVEQLRAAAGLGPSTLTPLSEYSLKSSEPSLHLSSSPGSSSYKLTGSASSLLSPQTSFSNLCLADSGPGSQNPLLVTSPSSENLDPFSENSSVVGHFHSGNGSFSPGEFRPRASSNASSTCSTHGVNLLNVDSSESHQVASLSPHNWSGDLRSLYNSTGGSFSSGLEQTVAGNGYRTSSGQEISQMQLIDCLANLGTGSSSSAAAHNYRMMTDDDLHKSTPPVVFHGPVPPPNHESVTGAHSDMIILGPDLAAAQQQQQHGSAAASASHGYNDLYKLQSSQSGSQTAAVSPSSASPPANSSSKPCFTSLDSTSSKPTSTTPTPPYFKSSSLIEPSAVSGSGKVHEINNNNSATGSTGSLYETSNSYSRYGETQHRTSSLTNLAYQHGQHLAPGKVSLGAFMYAPDPSQVGCYGYGNEAQFGYYDYPGVSHEALSSLTYATHVPGGSDIDLDFDTVCSQSGMLECDVDQVIRHELSVDGSLDFGLTSAGTNADSTTSSTPTTPTTSCSQNSTYPMRSTEPAAPGPQPAQSSEAAPSPPPPSMDIEYADGEDSRPPRPFYAPSGTPTSHSTTYTTLSSVAAAAAAQQSSTQHSPPVVPLRPSIIYGPYSPTQYIATGHYPSPAAVAVAAAAAETAVSVSVTSPVTASGHHQQPVTSRSWVH